MAVNNNGNLYYYDGVLKGKTAIMGGVCEIEANTYIDLGTEGSLEVASLKPIDYVAEVTNSEYTDEKCNTLKDAINKCENNANSTIKIIADFTIDEENKGIVQSTQDITINLNGHTITVFPTNSCIQNNGTLKIKDLSNGNAGAIISKGKTIIDNIGTLEVDDITIRACKEGINTTTLNYIIDNSGSFTLNSGTLEMLDINYVRILNNKGNGTMKIKGGNIASKLGNYAIYNNSIGTITLNSSNITGEKDYVVYNAGTGKITVDGATINSTSTTSSYWYSCDGIYNNTGTIEVKSGTVTAKGSYAIYNNSGTVTVSGGYLKGQYYAIYNVSGNATVTGGTLEVDSGHYHTHAVIYNGTGTITLGEKFGGVSTSNPSLNGKYYGVFNSNGTFNFYDGIIETREDYSISGSKSDLEEDYNIVTYKNGESAEFAVISGREKTILKQVEVAKIGQTKYSSVIQAFNEAEDGDTIEMLRSTSISAIQNTIQIDQNKSITLDLAGCTISSAKDKTIINSGSLEIIDSSVGQTGCLLNTTGIVIENLATGTFTLTSGSVKTNRSNVIVNKGDVIIQGGTVSIEEYSQFYAIKNENSGNITMSSGNITSNGNGIESNSDGNINISGGTITSRRE